MKSDLYLHISKVFLTLGGFSTVAASCSKSTVSDSIGMESFAPDNEDGLSLLPFELYVKPDVNIQGLIKFANDIIASDNLQKEFNANPNEILERYNITSFDASSPQIQSLMAMGDAEVISAIKSNDFNAYLSVMEKKQYLQSDLVKEIKRQLDQGITLDQTKQVAPVACFVPIVVAVFLGVVLFAVAVAAVVVAVDGLNGMATTSGSGDINGENYDLSSIIKDDAVTLFIDKSKHLKTIEIGEEEYVSELREKVSSIEGVKEKDAEKAFQVTCGTMKSLIDEKE